MIPKRVVLDTNVCLDLFVFRDSRWNLLLTALQSGDIEAVTRADCRMEWLLVLEYPHLPLDNTTKLQSAAEFDALITCMPPKEVTQQSKAILPICTDPDDQKFLELAQDAQAAVLITKDKALLKLAKKTTRAGMFSIMLPQTWIAAQ
jgi:putative PIN family toxin of toxin-antitoxin system